MLLSLPVQGSSSTSMGSMGEVTSAEGWISSEPLRQLPSGTVGADASPQLASLRRLPLSRRSEHSARPSRSRLPVLDPGAVCGGTWSPQLVRHCSGPKCSSVVSTMS
jgi:hypothetical protein